MESYRPVVAILLASGLFAMPHVFSLSGQGKIVSVSIVFLLALVLGASYVYSENIVVPSVIHGTFNAVQFGGAYLFSTGAL
jgi:membrane protease YdiL (CAAX protease family)